MAKKSSKQTEKITHKLMGEHSLLSEEQKQKVLSAFGASIESFPKIYVSDPALFGMEANPGDMVLIKRQDRTGNYDYYRIVIKG